MDNLHLEREEELERDVKESLCDIPVVTRFSSILMAMYKLPKHPKLARVQTGNIFLTTLPGNLSGSEEGGSQGAPPHQEPADNAPSEDNLDFLQGVDLEVKLNGTSKRRSGAAWGAGSEICRSPDVPAHSQIPCTGFLVDHFEGDRLPWVKAHFLTHAHQTQLKHFNLKTLRCPVYCSPITARLLKLFEPKLGEHPMICPLPLDRAARLQEVTVIPIDSNHCPGSVMWLFLLKCPKTSARKVVLHTGHFRATREMESLPVFWNHSVDILYLDTKHISVDFSSAEETLALLLDKIRAETNKRKSVESHDALVVCGSYFLGSEKVFLKLSAILNCSIWMPRAKRAVLSNILHVQTDNNRAISYDSQKDSTLHVLPNKLINHEFLGNYLEELRLTYKGIRFKRVVGIRVCSRMKSNFNLARSERNLVTIYSVDYSLHSSRTELTRFLRFLKPSEAIIPLEKCNDDLLSLGSAR